MPSSHPHRSWASVSHGEDATRSGHVSGGSPSRGSASSSGGKANRQVGGSFGLYSEFDATFGLHLDDCRQEKNGDVMVSGYFKDTKEGVDVKYILKSNIVQDEVERLFSDSFSFCTSSGDLFSDSNGGFEYNEEATLLNNLQGSRHIASFYGSYTLGCTFPDHQFAAFLVTESTSGKHRLDAWSSNTAMACFGEGQHFGCHWEDVNRAAFQERLHVARQILEAVKHMHQNDVAHGNLGIESFYVTLDDSSAAGNQSMPQRPQVKLHNFSTVSRASASEQLAFASIFETPVRSPEQLSRFMPPDVTVLSPPTRKSDLWALGILFSRVLYNIDMTGHFEEYLGYLISPADVFDDGKRDANAQQEMKRAWLLRFLFGSERDDLFPTAPVNANDEDIKFFRRFHKGKEFTLRLLELEPARPAAEDALKMLCELIETQEERT